MAILEVQNIRKRYASSEKEALCGLSFSVQKQEFFGLLGKNGSGKTTLISIICGLLKASSGNIYINGHANPFGNKKIYQQLALVPQDIALYPTLTLKENLTFFANLYGLNKKQQQQRIQTVCELTQLSDYLLKPIATFSGGLKRRANLALSLLHEPKLLLLDEPMVHVDTQSREIIMAGLTALNRQGCTIIYTSHYMEEIEKLCSRVMIIDQGNFVLEGVPQELIKADASVANLTELFLKIVD